MCEDEYKIIDNLKGSWKYAGYKTSPENNKKIDVYTGICEIREESGNIEIHGTRQYTRVKDEDDPKPKEIHWKTQIVHKYYDKDNKDIFKLLTHHRCKPSGEDPITIFTDLKLNKVSDDEFYLEGEYHVSGACNSHDYPCLRGPIVFERPF